MDRVTKNLEIEKIYSEAVKSTTVVVAHYHGSTVKEITALRNAMREGGCYLKVAKNTLTKIAVSKADKSALNDFLTGPVILAFSEDAVAPAKIMVDFAKVNQNLIIRGGIFEKNALDVKGVEALAKLPSLDALRSKIVGLINSPAQGLLRVVNTPAVQILNVLNARK